MKLLTKNNKWHFILSTTLGLIWTSLSIFSAYFLFIVLNKVMENEQGSKVTIQNIYLYLVFLLVLYLVMSSLNFLYKISLTFLRKKSEIHIKAIITAKINSLSPEEFESYKKGDYLSWYNSDSSDIYTSQVANKIDIIVNFFQIIASILVLFILLSWILGLATIIITIILIISSGIVGSLSNKKKKELSLENENFSQSLENLLNGYNEFKYRNEKSLFTRLILLSNKKLEQKKIELHNTQFIAYTLNGVLGLFFQFGVQIIAIILFINKKVEAGAILSSLQLSGYFIQGFGGFMNAMFIHKSSSILLNKFLPVNEYLDEELKKINFKELSIEKLNYQINNKKIFNGFNLKIEANKKYLISGESGKGKSTLIKIIFGLIEPNDGNLIINGNINYKNLSKNEIWNIASYLTQEPVIFNDTLRNNITLWNDQISDSQIIDILNKVNLNNLLLNYGLNKVINSEQKNLSGGEIQRISIARNLIRNKPILILDEATSALDKHNTKLIEELITKIDKTVLFISHTTNINDKLFDEVIMI